MVAQIGQDDARMPQQQLSLKGAENEQDSIVSITSL